MPQGPIKVSVTQPGGNKSSLNITAAVVVKATNGITFSITTSTAGTAGDLVLNDNNALGASNTAANQIISIPFGSLAAGSVVTLKWPCSTGITVSAVPTGWVGAVSYS